MNNFIILLAQESAGILAGFSLGDLIASGLALISTVVAGYFAVRSKKIENKAVLESKEQEKQYDIKLRELELSHTVREKEREQQITFYNKIMEDYNSVRLLANKLQDMVEDLSKEVGELKEKLKFYEENSLGREAREIIVKIMDSFNMPAWIHEIDSHQWYLNDEYCKRFNIKRKSFWTPINIFGHLNETEALEKLGQDLEVYKSGASIEFISKRIIHNYLPGHEKELECRTLKTPFTVGGRAYIFGRVLEIIE